MDLDIVAAAIPALASCSPGALLMKQIISLLMLIIELPPDPLVDARHRLCVGETGVWQGRNVFHIFSYPPFVFLKSLARVLKHI
jgi:hypothetical protein